MDEFRLMTFEDAGFPEELHNEADCRRAVKSGRVVADTEIEIYPMEGGAYHRPASEAPVLRHLLAPPVVEESEEPVAPAEADLEPEQEVEDAAVAPDTADSSVPAREPLAEKESRAAPRSRPTPPELPAPPVAQPISSSRDRGGWVGPWIVWPIIVVVLVVAFLATREESPRPEAATPIVEPVETPPPAPVDPEANLPRQTFYATREINLQPSAKSGGTDNTPKLARGAVLRGVVIAGEASDERWLHITEGPHTGLYVWTGNLSSTERPALDTSISGLMEIGADTQVRTAPDGNSPAIPGTRSALSPGQKVLVAGVVNGAWAELTLVAGGVGYVETSSLVSASEQPDASAPSPVPDVAATYTPSRFRDVYIRNKCSTNLRLALYYLSPGGWRTGGIWNLTGGYTNYVLADSARVSAQTSEIYWAEFNASHEQIEVPENGRTATLNGRSIVMRKAHVKLASDGDYEIDFTCG
ncbi:SH3 domain-containing protein [Sphingomonas sp. LT1P40]|uniref:SH3 domain-containing protein n=1 Tax=Alteristakelama amylovorans TaxID=3096166 RepID=UPI002FC877D8